ncbi:ATP-binding protein [Paraclostridium sordellii]|uniref:ATP-binding protein n=1 Tax=Paraclostridium sordellii TaxID=1505 RepID=UPI0005E11679|nr:ATP-binding protein [Paeniclostridium sordellii]CEO21855.1 two-component signal transduction sensor histidine kinase [[Clostridium] sordellii] [Paeniclostridium sordellii]CEQ13880.1 two-component signal transduction sensor histidine kinase [[Clostridium] sordellii] [Paeniclostridium sordellii]
MLEDNKLFFTFIIFVSSIIDWGALNILLSESFKVKLSKVTLTFILIIFSILTSYIQLIGMKIYLIENKNLMILKILELGISIIGVYIYTNICYDINLCKSLTISILYIFITHIFGELTYLFVSILCNKLLRMEYIWYYTLIYENLVFIEVTVLSKLLLIYLVTVIKFLKLKMKFNIKEYSCMIFSILINLISATLIFSIIYKTTQSITNQFLDSIIVVISMSIWFFNGCLMWLIIRFMKDSRLKAENKCIKENIALQYNYYLNMQHSQQKIRNLYHDMKNHMICIEKIYGENDYIKSINKQLNEFTYIYNTNNIILDIILNDKRNICENKKIELVADINFKECNFIDITDVCSIFSNIIDNAIEACDKIENNKIEKKIRLKGTNVNRLYVLKCENTKLNKINKKNELFMTDKKDKFLHGVGIKSIKASVEKYNGNLELNDLGNKFLVNIFIPLNN